MGRAKNAKGEMEDIRLLNSYTEKDNSAAEGMTAAMWSVDSIGKS